MAIQMEKKLTSKLILELSWLKISLDEIKIENGIESTRIVLDHPGASCILAITPEQKVLLVTQYRYATQEVLYEIPAGKLDAWGGDYYKTAIRELAEETPYTAKSMKLLSAFYTAPGFCNEFIHLYKAEGLEKNSTLELDMDEFVDVHYFSKHEIREMMQNGVIHDAKTIIALQYWLFEDHEVR
ncbi:ADP-ribose pyrophosphatase [Erysipelotrichaceae bacterium]|nr:ADP-ribose pyrophosphatase [Erysipelotrichaceae bacterium]